MGLMKIVKHILTFMGVIVTLKTVRFAVKLLDSESPQSHRAMSQSQIGSQNSMDIVSNPWTQSSIYRLVSQLELKFKDEHNPHKERIKIFFKSLNHIPKTKGNKTLWRQMDLMNLLPNKPDPEFRNPCWRSNTSPISSCVPEEYTKSKWKWKSNRNISSDGIYFHCLPYFLIIGQAKAGTTDLFEKIIRHPDVATTTIKEKQWFVRSRLHNPESCASIESYIGMFQDGAEDILRRHKPESYNPYVTGDATPGYFSNNIFWDLLPGNEGCEEPCVTNADIIHHIVPTAKLILVLRNPTDRLYSFYHHKQGITGVATSRPTFHRLVLREIGKFQKCLESQTLRGCCYNYTVSDDLTEELDLRRGIYHVYLSDWLKVFPRDQIYIIKFEDYSVNGIDHLVDIFQFLKLRNLSEEDLIHINKMKPANSRTNSYRQVGAMWDSTRQILDEFYKPFTRELSTLLKDTRFLW